MYVLSENGDMPAIAMLVDPRSVHLDPAWMVPSVLGWYPSVGGYLVSGSRSPNLRPQGLQELM